MDGFDLGSAAALAEALGGKPEGEGAIAFLAHPVVAAICKSATATPGCFVNAGTAARSKRS